MYFNDQKAVFFCICIFGYLIASGCTNTPSITFPDKDIVYQIGDPNDPKIGFVNADGTGKEILDVDSYLAKPTWSPEKTLYALEWSGAGAHTGYASFWQEKKARITCRNDRWQAVKSIELMPGSDPALAIINNAGYQILSIDLNSCQETKMYIDVSQASSTTIQGISISPDGNKILYAEKGDVSISSPTYSISVLDIVSEKVVEVGIGVNPTWSGDGQWIAYIWLDGIYIMAFDGSQNRRLITYNYEDGFSPGEFITTTPLPRWSPDGKWLVYHKCLQSLATCSVMKLEISTGQETQVAENGLYPFWRGR